MNTLQNTTT